MPRRYNNYRKRNSRSGFNLAKKLEATRPVLDNKLLHASDIEYKIKPLQAIVIPWFDRTTVVPTLDDLKLDVTNTMVATLGSKVNGILYDLRIEPTTNDPQDYAISYVSLDNELFIKDMVANAPTASYGQWKVDGTTGIVSGPDPFTTSINLTELGSYATIFRWKLRNLFARTPHLLFHRRIHIPYNYSTVRPYQYFGFAILNMSNSDITVKLHRRFNEFIASQVL